MGSFSQGKVFRLEVQRLIVFLIIDEAVERWIERIHEFDVRFGRDFLARQEVCCVDDQTSQIFINTAMVCGMFPIVGIPLPLVSYGGSTLVTVSFGLSLILNIGYRRGLF